MDNLKGKKLLILGSTSRTIDFVNYAREMGVYSIVTDWNDPSKAPVKLAADEHWEVSLMDYDELAKRIEMNHIDGIITGFTDSYLLPYQHLCEITNLPCYATKEVFERTLDKSKFKEMCLQNDLPVVPEYSLKTFDIRSINNENKILIKPVDNSGSRGIIVCSTPDKFQECLEYSLSFSKKREVVIEKFMEMDTFSVSYTIQDGIISMSTMNDRIVHKTENAGAVTAGGIYPSKYIDLYMDKMDSKVKNMFINLGVKNGVLFVQAFTDGCYFYFYEMGYRISGGRHYVYTEHQNRTNAAKNLIHFALTGKMADYIISERDNPKFSNICCQVNILGKEGKIATINGLQYLKNLPEIIDVTMFKGIDDEIGQDGTTAQQIVGIYTISENINQFEHLCSEIKNNFKVLDKDGNSLVLDILK